MTETIRVAHVIHHLAAGGTERRLLALLGSLDRDRYRPLLVCVNEAGDLAEEARALGVPPIVLGRRGRFDASGIPRLAALLHRERAQVVHGWLSLANVFARVGGALGGVPVRIAAEGGAVTTRDARRVRRDAAIDRLLDPLTHAYVANSEAVAASLRARGLPPGKIVVVPNGVVVPPPLPQEERHRLRLELGVSGDERLVGMVARLDPDFKDHETFLESVAALVAGGMAVRAAVIGDGPGRAPLEERARLLGIAERVVFTGYRSDAARLLGVLDVSVLLTYSEGFSNVVLESMAAAVPLVVTRILPNLEAVEDGVHALVVPVGDAVATADALRRLLLDSELGARLAAAARARAAARFTPEAQAQATASLYERLLAAGAPSGTSTL